MIKIIIIMLAITTCFYHQGNAAPSKIQKSTKSTQKVSKSASSQQVKLVNSSHKSQAKMTMDDMYERGLSLAKKKNYSDALKYFKKVEAKDPRNPDVLNMIAFSKRKLGDLDTAFKYYKKALKLRPKFPEAREYLGEAHIQAALKELSTLKGYGEEGEEAYKDLKKALKRASRKAGSTNDIDVDVSEW